MNISPVRLDCVKKPVVFKGLTKKAAQKLISFGEDLNLSEKKDCLEKIEALAKKVENSHTDIDYTKGYVKTYKNSMSNDPKDIRLVEFEGLKIIDTSDNQRKTIGFMPIRNLFMRNFEVRVDNGGTYKDNYTDKNGMAHTKNSQYIGLYPERFSDFMEKLNKVVDLNEGITTKKVRSNREIADSILAHSIDNQTN